MILDRIIDKIKEECGVFGIFSGKNINLSSILYTSLNSLQHRGQESSGISFSNGKEIKSIKEMGLASELFKNESAKNVRGVSAIGHTRYSTSGDSNLKNAQPLLDYCILGDISIAHNGNITNANFYRKHLINIGVKFNTVSDSEVFLKLFLKEINSYDIKDSLINTMKKIKGSYSILILFKDKLIGIRDPNGIRPLCIGNLNGSYILASESCTLNSLGAELIRDVNPGEIVIINRNGIESIDSNLNCKLGICSLEYIYFAREDSIIDGTSVYKSRLLSGKYLYEEHPIDADIVIGIPDSGIASAMGYSKASGIDYEIGFVKNKYIGRTFINPSKNKREKDIFIKLNLINENIKGKRIVVVDDSIVRGNTSQKIVFMLKSAGAKEIHLRIASPIIKSPCYLGINMKSKKELIGSKHLDEIKNFLRVDSIGYISIDSFLNTLKRSKEVCLKCFR